MIFFRYRTKPRSFILILIAGGALLVSPMALASESKASGGSSPVQDRPGPIHVAVSGASAGITTDYFETAIADAISTSGVFSGIDSSPTTEVTMRMIGASGTFSSAAGNIDTPYLLKIRIIKVETPSFSSRMTVSMNAIWDFYRIPESEPLLHENIHSTYTGGAFEGGLHGANRVRVAMEGAARNNIGIGVGMLTSMDFDRE